jgi:hypothetical protein
LFNFIFSASVMAHQKLRVVAPEIVELYYFSTFSPVCPKVDISAPKNARTPSITSSLPTSHFGYSQILSPLCKNP